MEQNATLKGKNRKETLFVHVFRIQQSLSILILHYKPAAVEIIVMVAPERFQNIDLQKIRPEISPGNSRHMILICSMSTSAKGWPCFLLGPGFMYLIFSSLDFLGKTGRQLNAT